MLKYIDQLKGYEYSIPQRGTVTKENAKDLYNIVKALNIYNNFKLTSKMIDILLNDKIKEINKLNSLSAEESIISTYKQKKALIRIIFGKHYCVKVYCNLMALLTKLDNVYQIKERPSTIRSEVSIADIESPIVENREEVKKNRRKADQDQVYFYNEVILPFLKGLAKDLKGYDLKEEKKIMVNDLLSIVQMTS